MGVRKEHFHLHTPERYAIGHTRQKTLLSPLVVYPSRAIGVAAPFLLGSPRVRHGTALNSATAIRCLSTLPTEGNSP